MKVRNPESYSTTSGCDCIQWLQGTLEQRSGSAVRHVLLVEGHCTKSVQLVEEYMSIFRPQIVSGCELSEF